MSAGHPARTAFHMRRWASALTHGGGVRGDSLRGIPMKPLGKYARNGATQQIADAKIWRVLRRQSPRPVGIEREGSGTVAKRQLVP